MAIEMSALQPRPLPDVPFARPAPDPADIAAPPAAFWPTQPGQSYARPVGRVARLFLFLPAPLTILFAGLFLLRQYYSGATFTHDINHAIAWFFDAVIFGVAAGHLLVIALVILAATWRRLEPVARLRAGGRLLAATAVFVFTLTGSGSLFQKAKSRAYARVNMTFLTADCRAVAASLTPSPNSNGSDTLEGTDPSLPAYLRSLGPRFVIVTAESVEVVMSHDYFSGTDHESFVVPLGPPPADPVAYAAQKQLTVLCKQPAVFRWRKPR